MLLSWFTERRRRRVLETPFPEAWRAIMARDVAQWSGLDDDERERLCELVQVFVAEKHWEGCGGLALTDAIKVTIAAEACLLLLGRDHGLYGDVASILVYPSTVVPPERPRGFFAQSLEVQGAPAPLVGEAHLGGPVILVWDEVRRGARRPDDGRNVVFHEFAHKIDMLDGEVDGTPPLPDRARRADWASVCSAVYLALRENDPAIRRVLDPYGATNEAEFFAVATESFFERPVALREALPALYDLLADFYRQDPCARAARRPR
jgi:Mlc titration factor MtfA (ptsG expression regulator)